MTYHKNAISFGPTKIAIIGPSFFGYLETLETGFRDRGINTHFFDERWSNTVASKIVSRFFPKFFYRRKIDEHQKEIFDKIIAHKTTHVLVISAESFPVALLAILKEKGIKIVSYSFDSFANKPHMRKVAEISESAASFDPVDCKDTNLSYIPLYSNLDHEAKNTPIDQRSIDFLYFGTLHSNRPFWVSRAKTICTANNWNDQFFLYFHSKILWYLRFILQPTVWTLGRELSTKHFPSHQLYDATANSKVVIDIHHPKQTGLTMRVFEAISGGSVIISTNPNIETALPSKIARERVRSFDKENLKKTMQEALTMTPPPLLPDEIHYLSAQRYIDQLCELLLQPSDDEFPKDLEL